MLSSILKQQKISLTIVDFILHCYYTLQYSQTLHPLNKWSPFHASAHTQAHRNRKDIHLFVVFHTQLLYIRVSFLLYLFLFDSFAQFLFSFCVSKEKNMQLYFCFWFKNPALVLAQTISNATLLPTERPNDFTTVYSCPQKAPRSRQHHYHYTTTLSFTASTNISCAIVIITHHALCCFTATAHINATTAHY